MSHFSFKRFAVIYIGSNEIRLTVFDHLMRGLIPILNEKKNNAATIIDKKTNQITVAEITYIADTINHYKTLAQAHHVSEIILWGSSLLIEAENSSQMLDYIEKTTHLPVKKLSIKQDLCHTGEAILYGHKDPEGIMSYIGGLNVGFAEIKDQAVINSNYLEIGPLKIIQQNLSIDAITEVFLTQNHFQFDQKNLYAAGSYWRMIAKACLIYFKHPLSIVHHYELSHSQITDFLDHICALNHYQIRHHYYRITKSRLREFITICHVFKKIFSHIKPSKIIFSAFGPSEGYLFSNFTNREKAENSLLHTCQILSEQLNSLSGVEFMLEKMRPLKTHFPNIPDEIFDAAILLSDIGWIEHPDYKADIVFKRVLTFPLPYINHPERVLLAACVTSRYESKLHKDKTKLLKHFYHDAPLQEIQEFGKIIHFIYKFFNACPSLIAHLNLFYHDDILTIEFTEEISNTILHEIQTYLKKSFKNFKIIQPEMSLI